MLAARWQKRRDLHARNQLVLANLRWALKWTARHSWYARKTAGLVEEEDYYQIAVLGLIRACDDFDPAKGRYTTHASTWIKSYCLRTRRDHESAVRIPSNLQDAMARYREAGAQGKKRMPPRPRYMAWGVAAEQKAIRISRRDGRAEGNEEPLAQHIADPRALRSDVLPAKHDQEQHAKEMLDRLPPRTAEMVWQHVALDRTLEDISKEHGVSRERVRQIVEKGLETLRHLVKDTGA